jgi:hypothetical protein
MTTNEDPIAKAIESLPDEPISPALARNVGRNARAALEGESHFWVRFDRLWMDRLMPVALGSSALVYMLGLVDFLGRTYVG